MLKMRTSLSNQKLAWGLAGLLFLLDRISKYWIVEVYDLVEKGSVSVLPFFNLTMVWNYGISMGLLTASDDLGRWLLIAGTSAVVVMLIFWLRQEVVRRNCIAIGMIIGGAIGNIWDRFEYGAVADFIHLHLAEYSFYVFNVADAAISGGVLILLLDALLSSQKQHT